LVFNTVSACLPPPLHVGAAAALPDALNIRASDTVLPVVPLFHANGWGMVCARSAVAALCRGCTM
jgi:hypothetical protein